MKTSETIRVLVVDDELEFCELVKLNLERAGNYRVEIADDPGLAVSYAGDFLPHVIVLDVVMPGMDGGDLVRLFDDDPVLKKIPILVVSGQVREERGRPNVLAKPVTTERLAASVDRLAFTERGDEAI